MMASAPMASAVMDRMPPPRRPLAASSVCTAPGPPSLARGEETFESMLAGRWAETFAKMSTQPRVNSCEQPSSGLWASHTRLYIDLHNPEASAPALSPLTDCMSRLTRSQWTRRRAVMNWTASGGSSQSSEATMTSHWRHSAACPNCSAMRQYADSETNIRSSGVRGGKRHGCIAEFHPVKYTRRTCCLARYLCVSHMSAWRRLSMDGGASWDGLSRPPRSTGPSPSVPAPVPELVAAMSRGSVC